MDGDFAVSLGVGDAGKDETLVHLVVIEEGLLGLVDFSREDLSGAGGASSGTARVRKLNTLFLGGIDNEDIIGTFNGGINVVFLTDELDRVSQSSAHLVGGNNGSESRNGGDGSENEEGLGEHDEIDVM